MPDRPARKPDQDKPFFFPPSVQDDLLAILDEEPDAPLSLPCPLCTGPCFPLGRLGTRVHFRCRNCGLELSNYEGAD